MEASDIEALIAAEFPDADIDVLVDGSHCSVTITDASFVGMRPVARQQKVYAPLSASIASGAIHAVNIRALTPPGSD